MLLHGILPDWLPYKAKMCQRWGQRGCLLPVLTWLSRERLQWGGQTFHTLGREEGKYRQGFFP